MKKKLTGTQKLALGGVLTVLLGGALYALHDKRRYPLTVPVTVNTFPTNNNRRKRQEAEDAEYQRALDELGLTKSRREKAAKNAAAKAAANEAAKAAANEAAKTRGSSA